MTNIAFQGVKGAHSDLACQQAYPYHTTIAQPSFKSVFDSVENGEAEIGLVPVGNSYAGRVAEIHNLIHNTTLNIIGEHLISIEHHLMAAKGTKLEDIDEVFSHPQALMQCNKHLDELDINNRTAKANTAMAAEYVAELGDNNKAALASKLAAELYGLEIIKPDMQDATDNKTLFLAIAKEPKDYDLEKDAPFLTSLLFSTRNIPASLYKALGGFATNNVNMVKLESYIPEGNSKSARFMITIDGHPQDKNVNLALEELGFFTNKVQVLGVYPADKNRLL